MTVNLISTHTVKSTWLGRPGISMTMHYDRNRFGKRISVIIWQDDGRAEVKAIKGDGRRAGFQTLEKIELPTHVGVGAIVCQMAERHF